MPAATGSLVLSCMELVVDGHRDLIVTACMSDHVSRIIGHLTVAFGKAGSLESPMIQRVYVDPSFRRRGIGSQLMGFALHRVLNSNGGIITLVVASDNHGVVPFYQRLGFTPAYIYADGSILMSAFHAP